MARDIPEGMPTKIAHLIDSQYGGLTPFAAACGLTYHEVHQILCRNNHRALRILVKWSEYLKTDPESLAEAILLPTVDKRRDAVQTLAMVAGFESVNQVCTTYGEDRKWISRQINGKSKQSQISPRVTVCEKLKLSLLAFLGEYEDDLAVA